MDRRQFLGLTGAAAGAALAAPAWAARLVAAAPADSRLRELAKTIHGTVVAPGSPAYAEARLAESTRFDAIHPHAVVYCATAGDVEKAILWARKHGVHVVARSGGHSYGGYSTTAGVVLDVSRLAQIRVAPGGKTAVVGAGAQLIDVYSALFAHGVTIPAGSCATVGIAGLTLGGGVGFTSRALGLTCDNVESLQLVTAAGQLLTCDTSHHSDLFWACRGGGGGTFGIVTSFTFRTHPISTVATYFVEWPWEQALQAVQAWQAFAAAAPDALFSVCDLEATDPGGPASRSHVVSSGQFFGTEAELLALIKPLVDAGTPTNVTTHTRSGIEAALFWAGCSSETVAQCHTSPAKRDGVRPPRPAVRDPVHGRATAGCAHGPARREHAVAERAACRAANRRLGPGLPPRHGPHTPPPRHGQGADLGERNGKLVLDFNFAYNPSCSYDPGWVCPLAPPGSRLSGPIRAGERLP